jgi:RNase H-fold protein (predicted Holliday junction resolvase)
MRILALDRWTKKIGLARRSSDTKITFPLWFLPNTPDTLADILHLMQKYAIDTIVYGNPHIARLKEQLTTITEQLIQASPWLVCVACNEAYTSVQADILLEQTNHPWQDAVAAMYILDTYLETLQK